MEEQTEKRPPLILPELGSQAGFSYFWAASCDYRLYAYIAQTFVVGDHIFYNLERIAKGQGRDKDMTAVRLAREKPGPRIRGLRKSAQELQEMFLCRLVDNFQIYIVEMVRSVLHKQPRILSASKKEFSLGYILEFESIEALAREIIEAKVASLSYEGFGDLEDWCRDKGIPLVVPHGERDAIVELIATRNLIVHNRGFIDDRFKRAVASCTSDVGEKLALQVDSWFSARDLLHKVVALTDVSVSGKFGIDQINIRDEVGKKGQERWKREDDEEDDEDATASDTEISSNQLPEPGDQKPDS